jgi:hypothetical protein
MQEKQSKIAADEERAVFEKMSAIKQKLSSS